jgi:hypothetical protein
VLYYLLLPVTQVQRTAVAVVALYSLPHARLLELSSDTLMSCTHLGDAGIKVIEVKSITAVIAMVPHQPRLGGDPPELRYFVVEKPGEDVAQLAGAIEENPEDIV